MYPSVSPSIKRRVFYSFHYKKDAWRAGQIRNIGVIEGNSSVSDNDWEEVERGKNQAIKRWIDDNMKERSCLIVLVGEETATRYWVKYEIERAWNTGMGVVGIYIHNIKDIYSRLSQKGKDPFEFVILNILNNGIKLSYYVKCFEPNPNDAYNDIAKNLERLVEEAIEQRRRIGSSFKCLNTPPQNSFWKNL
jgi:hypothetical protein